MKCIIPIAGLGTRLLPFSKVIPKALLPVADKPCVQWIVEELSEAGIEEIIFVYSRGQEMVEDYFNKKTWYDEELEKRGKKEEVEKLEKIRNLAKFHFVEQDRQLGDGHAILQAKELIDEGEAFLVIFGDCLYSGDDVITKMLSLHEEKKSCIVAVQEIPQNQTQNYGIVDAISPIRTFVEKPRPEDAPSTLAIIGRYLLTPSIWTELEKEVSHSGELRLIDALDELKKDEEIYGIQLEGDWLDTGTLEGLKKAGEIKAKKS